jgi:hypothetical protein
MDRRLYVTTLLNAWSCISALVGKRNRMCLSLPERGEAIPNLQAHWAVGGSSIVAPGGAYLVAPIINQEKILYAELDFDLRRFGKHLLIRWVTTRAPTCQPTTA